MCKHIRVKTPEDCPFCTVYDRSTYAWCSVGTHRLVGKVECTGYYIGQFNGDCPLMNGSVVVGPQPIEDKEVTAEPTEEVRQMSNRAKLLGDTPIRRKKQGYY